MPLRILHLSYRLLQPFFIPGDQYHYGPHLATIYRTLPTDTGRSTCHDDQFIFQENGFIILPLYHLFYNLQMEQYP